MVFVFVLVLVLDVAPIWRHAGRTMPAMKLSPDQWAEVKKASEAGVDDAQLSQDFGISKGAIRIRRMRENWSTGKSRAEAVAVARVKSQFKGMPATGLVTGVTKPNAEESIAAKMAAQAEEIGLHAMAIIARKMKLAAENPETIDDFESIGDVATGAKTARSIAGLDKTEGGGIHINLGSFFGTSREEREVQAVVLKPRPSVD